MPVPYSPDLLVFDAYNAAETPDGDFFWLDLMNWLPPGDTVTLTSITIASITGDPNPPTVSEQVVQTSSTTVGAGSTAYFSTGPRLFCRITGGTPGYDYRVVFAWTDSQGRSIQRTVFLPARKR